jgi:hypothetical protein
MNTRLVLLHITICLYALLLSMTLDTVIAADNTVSL